MFMDGSVSLHFSPPVALLPASIKKNYWPASGCELRNLPKACAEFQSTANIGSVGIGRKWASVLDYFLVKTRFGPLSTCMYAKNAADMTRRLRPKIMGDYSKYSKTQKLNYEGNELLLLGVRAF
jgi:hypothetical protein